ncbi:hypothetical protein ACS8E9_18650 [Pseudomonas neustonica]|uniref:hypothetical protein n=1 Tax=Pseudomonas neustonica TaxID=2487346 RepID=UPI003F46E53A
MRVHKVENLESRVARFKQERLSFVFTEALPIFSLCVVLSIGLMYAVNRWLGAYDNWLIVGAVVGACLSMPPVLATMPKRPTIEDVHADQSIRRAYGMDDTVDD